MIKFLPLLLTGCQMSAGLAVHPNADYPEYSGNNPMGVVLATEPITEDIDGFYLHSSSLQDNEEGYGLNIFGIITRIK